MRLTYTPDREQDRFVLDDVPLKAGESTEVADDRARQILERYPDQFTAAPAPAQADESKAGAKKKDAAPKPPAQSTSDKAPSQKTGDVST